MQDAVARPVRILALVISSRSAATESDDCHNLRIGAGHGCIAFAFARLIKPKARGKETPFGIGSEWRGLVSITFGRCLTPHRDGHIGSAPIDGDAVAKIVHARIAP